MDSTTDNAPTQTEVLSPSERKVDFQTDLLDCSSSDDPKRHCKQREGDLGRFVFEEERFRVTSDHGKSKTNWSSTGAERNDYKRPWLLANGVPQTESEKIEHGCWLAPR